MPGDNKKAELRKKYLEKRLQITRLDAEKFSVQATGHLYTILTQKLNLELKPKVITKNIAIYQPIKNEINPSGIIGLLENSVTFSLPVIKNKKDMHFCHWKQGDSLNNNQFYPFILEPKAQEITHPDYIIIPLVAFDSNLNRLGYGGGYYDRAIAQEISLRKSKEKPILIGFAYSCQESDIPIPVDSNDIKLDYLITEKGLYR